MHARQPMASRAFSCRQWFGQWQQAMMPARTLALRRALFYLAARAGSLRVNRTAHFAANLALQCSAMRCS